MGNLHFGEILVLAILGVILFGKRLPDVARSVGRAIGEFRKAMTEEILTTEAPPQPGPPPANPAEPAAIEGNRTGLTTDAPDAPDATDAHR